WATLRTPSSSKSRTNVCPTEVRSCKRRSSVAMKNLLDRGINIEYRVSSLIKTTAFDKTNLTRTKTMRIATFVALGLALLTLLPVGQPKAEERIKTMTKKKIIPVRFAENIEPGVKCSVGSMASVMTVQGSEERN